LPRVEELFEARSPKGEAVISDIDGTVELYWEGEQRRAKVASSQIVSQDHVITEGFRLTVEDKDRVQEGTVLAEGPDEAVVVARIDGHVYFEEVDGQMVATVRREEREEKEYEIPASARLRVETADRVRSGDQLTEGPKSPREVLRIEGAEACQRYLLEEVQKVYRSQGVSIHDKHIEIIVRQMLRWVKILHGGDTGFMPSEIVDKFHFLETNEAALEAGGLPARGESELMGLTKASLNTSSFLAAASFQETTRVLTAAAVRGATDSLRGLKENVIIGKLIPVGTGFKALQEREAIKEAQKAAQIAAAAAPLRIEEPAVGGDGLTAKLAQALQQVEREAKQFAGSFGMLPGQDLAEEIPAESAAPEDASDGTSEAASEDVTEIPEADAAPQESE